MWSQPSTLVSTQDAFDFLDDIFLHKSSSNRSVVAPEDPAVAAPAFSAFSVAALEDQQFNAAAAAFSSQAAAFDDQADPFSGVMDPEDPLANACFLMTISDSCPDFGQRSPRWLNAMQDFPSARVYDNRLNDFFNYWHLKHEELSFAQAVLGYFEDKHKLMNDDGTPRHRPTSMRSWLSIFKKFVEEVPEYNYVLPIASIEGSLSKWEKKQARIIKAKTFSPCELIRMLTLPDTPDNLPSRVYGVISTGMAGRGIEVAYLKREDIEPLVVPGSPSAFNRYEVFYERAKSEGPPERLSAFITGEFECGVLTRYLGHLDSFNHPRNGRLFMKLTNKYKPTAPIGKNTLADAGKKLAGILGLPDHDAYTGHCWRRTAVTLACEKGLTLPQIKALTGHRSDTVVQGYIDR